MRNNPKYSIYFENRREHSNHRVLQKTNNFIDISRFFSAQKAKFNAKTQSRNQSTHQSRSFSKIQPRHKQFSSKSPKNSSKLLKYWSQLTFQYPDIDKFNRVFPSRNSSLRQSKIQQKSQISSVNQNPQYEQTSLKSSMRSLKSILVKITSRSKINQSVQESIEKSVNQYEHEQENESSIASNLKIEPLNGLFLCENCLQYFYKQHQIKCHNKNCCFIGWKYQYIQKWIKLSLLIQQAAKYKSQPQLAVIQSLIKSINTKKIQSNEKQTMNKIEKLLQNIQKSNLRFFDKSNLKWVIEKLIKGIRNGFENLPKCKLSKFLYCG